MTIAESSRPGEAHSGQESRLRDLPRNVWVVTITSFLTDVSSEMVINLIPLFLANALRVRTGTIGLIEGTAEMAASLLKIFSGWLSDRLGRRKWLAVAGYGLSSLAKPFLYLATTWGEVLAVRFADRVGKGIRTAPRDALIADSIPERHRGLAFGLHRAGDTAGAFAGLAFTAGVIWLIEGNSSGLARPAFQAVVLASIIPALVAVFVLAIGAREAVPQVRTVSRLPTLSLDGFDTPFRRFLIVMALFTLGNSSDAFLILRAQERGSSILGVIGMLLTLNLVYTWVSAPAGALSDRLGRSRLIAGGWLAYACIYLGFALAGSLVHIWLLFALYGLYYGVAEGAGKAMVADLVRPEQRGRAYGVYHGVLGLMVLPASLIAGVLWQGIGDWRGLGPEAAFVFGAAMALVAVILLVLWQPRWISTLPSPDNLPG